MHATLFRAITVLQDAGPWAAVALLLCAIVRLRRRVAALERGRAATAPVSTTTVYQSSPSTSPPSLAQLTREMKPLMRYETGAFR